MSDDEVSKVPEIKAFGIFAKSYIRDRDYYQSFNFTQISDYIVICTLRCVLFRQSALRNLISQWFLFIPSVLI